jgi:RHS repeat-associated protein
MRRLVVAITLSSCAGCGAGERAPAANHESSEADGASIDSDSGSEITPESGADGGSVLDSEVTIDAAVDVATDAGPPVTSTAYVYGQEDELLGEYDEDGNTLQELVYLEGRLVGVIRNGKVNAVQTDQLGSPRAVLSGGKTVWQWDPEPFGASAPNEDVDKDGTGFVFNERFPGQRFDETSGLQQNFHRNFAPESGRYVEADPLGLGGGFNVYEYAASNPISVADPTGLDPGDMFPTTDAAAADLLKYLIRNSGPKPAKFRPFFEYGSWIRRKGKCFYYDEPFTDQSPDSVRLLPRRPNDSAAAFHTHGLRGYMPGSDSLQFSPSDRSLAQQYEASGYAQATYMGTIVLNGEERTPLLLRSGRGADEAKDQKVNINQQNCDCK